MVCQRRVNHTVTGGVSAFFQYTAIVCLAAPSMCKIKRQSVCVMASRFRGLRPKIMTIGVSGIG